MLFAYCVVVHVFIHDSIHLNLALNNKLFLPQHHLHSSCVQLLFDNFLLLWYSVCFCFLNRGAGKKNTNNRIQAPTNSIQFALRWISLIKGILSISEQSDLIRYNRLVRKKNVFRIKKEWRRTQRDRKKRNIACISSVAIEISNLDRIDNAWKFEERWNSLHQTVNEPKNSTKITFRKYIR